MLLRTSDDSAALVSRGVTWFLMPAFCGLGSGCSDASVYRRAATLPNASPAARNAARTAASQISTRISTQCSTIDVVPSLNIPFTDEELAAVRAAAGGESLSLRAFAHRAVVTAASEHKRRVAEAATVIAERSAELNRRLA